MLAARGGNSFVNWWFNGQWRVVVLSLMVGGGACGTHEAARVAVIIWCCFVWYMQWCVIDRWWRAVVSLLIGSRIVRSSTCV